MNAAILTYFLPLSIYLRVLAPFHQWSLARKVLSVTVLLLTLSTFVAAAPSRPVIQGIRTVSSAGVTRVIISLSAPIAYELSAEPSAVTTTPSRLHLRFSPAHLAPGIRTTAKVDDGILKEVRTGLLADSIVRISLEVEQLGTYRASSFRSPDQVVIQLRKQPENRASARFPTPALPRVSSLKDTADQKEATALPAPSPSPPFKNQPLLPSTSLPQASSTREQDSGPVVDDDLADIEAILKRRGIQ